MLEQVAAVLQSPKPACKSEVALICSSNTIYYIARHDPCTCDCMPGVAAVAKQVASLASCVSAHGKTPLMCLPTWHCQAMCVMHSVTMVIQIH